MKENPIPWRVIRAAPDLLEALIDMVNLQWEPEGRDADAIFKKANAAIAKANGEFQPEERKEYAAK
jgi:hypothetical protein